MATSKELLTLQEQGAQIRILVGGEPTGGLVEYSPRYKGDRSPWVKVENTTRYRYTAKECGAVTEKEESVTDQEITPETPGTAHQTTAKNRLSDVQVGDLRTDSRGWRFRVADVKRRTGRSGSSITVSGRCVEDRQDGNTTTYGAYCYELAYDAAEPETQGPSGIAPEVIEALRTLRNSAGTPGAAHQRAMKTALDFLDNAGVFAAIDEATGYDIDPAPEKVSKCTCPGGTWEGQKHLTGCPGDPAEWGDAAFKYPVRNDWDAAQAEQNKGLDGYRAADRRAFPAETIPCDHCRGEYRPKKDGQPRKHNCWRFDHQLQTTTFGPLDVHGRSNTGE